MTRENRWMRAVAAMAIGVVGAGGSTLAMAQSTGTEKGADVLEEVVVTGSRIASPNGKSSSPIVAVTAQEIQVSGKTDISDIINQLPQNFNNDMGQDLGNRTSGLTTAGGVATADLRGLGPNRTLVLVNGRRLGNGSPYTAIQSPAPDLDQIPAAMIERVEVLTGGASAVYGSDAIAGVVNFILRKNFQGLEVSGQIGGNWHENHNTYMQGLERDAGVTPLTGSAHDGRNLAFNLIAGSNFGDGTGNITAYFNYLKADPVRSGDRDFGGCQLGADQDPATNEIHGASCGGSGNSNYFRPQNGPNALTEYAVLGSAFVPWGTAGTNPPQFFNSQPYIYMAREDERYTAGFLLRDELRDYLQPYAEFGFMNDRTYQEIAPTALFRDANPLDPFGNYNINCSNPLLSAQQAASLCSPADIAADLAKPGSVNANVRIGRRNTEGGGRSSDYEHTNFRAVLGAKGDFGTAWSYDAYAQYYYTQFYNSNDHYFDFQKITNALQVTGTAANPVCISGPPCVPYNIFNDGGVTDTQFNYLYLSGTAYGTTTLKTVHADVTGELGSYGLIVPTAHEGIVFNAGYEHRSDYVRFRPDAAELSGMLSGFGGASVAIDNGYSVDEANIEVRAPLVQDRTGVRDLIVGGGYRTSDYSTGAGRVGTYKFDVQYAPIQDLRFRASYNRAIRAPNNIELFNPQLVGQITINGDPCAPTPGPNGAVIAAKRPLADCLHTGVTAAQYGNGGTTNSIPQGTAGQLSQLQGGNPDLKAETADTVTYGVIISPTAMPNLTGSVDYYDIKLKDTVGSLSASVILDTCLNSGDPTYCSQIVRSRASGGLNGASVASGGYIVQTNVNIGAIRASGIDVQGAYRLNLPGGWGSLAFALNGTYLLKMETTPLPGAPSYDCVGLYGFTCQTVNPRWHHNLRATWATPRNVAVAMTWRYIGSVQQDNNSSDPALHFKTWGGFDFFNDHIPSYGYLDLSATWDVSKMWQLRAGVNNVLDKDPPLLTTEIVSGGAANTYSTYDQLGRQWFAAFTATL